MRYVSTALLCLCCSSLACSGHYLVGQMDEAVPNDSSGGSSAAGGSSAGGSGSGVGGGGPGGVKLECELPAGEPGALTAPFAEPDVVWQRLSLWLNGAVMIAPGAMPTSTTYDWSGQVAMDAFELSQQEQTGAFATRHYVTTAFDLEPDSAMAGDWTNRLASSAEPLQLLYATPWGEHRTGIFGEPEWLSRHPRTVSRGVSMLRGVFNQMVPPPPPTVNTTLPDDGANLSSRERLARHSANAICNACHSIIDPLGLALEHFDMNGNYRELDAGKPVNSSGTYSTSYSGEHFSFQSMEDLGPQIAQSCQARVAFADLNFKRALLDAGLLLEGEDITLAHQDDLARVRQTFVHQHDYPTLIRAIAQTSAFLR
jgi:hypothetical protein